MRGLPARRYRDATLVFTNLAQRTSVAVDATTAKRTSSVAAAAAAATVDWLGVRKRESDVEIEVASAQDAVAVTVMVDGRVPVAAALLPHFDSRFVCGHDCALPCAPAADGGGGGDQDGLDGVEIFLSATVGRAGPGRTP